MRGPRTEAAKSASRAMFVDSASLAIDSSGPGLPPARVVGAAADDLADVGQVRPRRPHLLAGEAPHLAVAHRPGLEAGEVGAGVGLGEQLAGEDIAPVEGGQPAAALLVGLGGRVGLL